MDRRAPVLVSLLAAFPGCRAEPQAIHAAPLWADGAALRSSDGRTVILRGINARVAGVFDVTFDDGRLPLEGIPDFTDGDAARARQLGFNVLRLPVNWSGLEPTRGAFSQGYLASVHAVVDRCRRVGMYVILDLHQDAWSKEIGEDGAPRWAIAPPPDMVLGGPLVDLGARRLSKQVLRAFKGFFTDDADMLQEEFIRAAVVLAREFAADDAVAGFEIFNEPLAGDAELAAFHKKVAASLRAEARKLVLFEPSVTRNFIDFAPLSSTPFPVADAVYAPHIYTLAFSDPNHRLDTLGYEYLAPSVRNARDEAAAWGTPLLVGEFGIAPWAKNASLWLGFELDAQDETLASSTFWVWKEEGGWGLFEHHPDGSYTERPAMIAAVTRPYVARAGGDLTEMHWDGAARAFRYTVKRTAAATVDEVFVPDFAGALTFRCDGAQLATTRDPATGVIAIHCGTDGTHTVDAAP